MHTKTRRARTLWQPLISGHKAANQRPKLFQRRVSPGKARHPRGTERDTQMMSNETSDFLLPVAGFCRIACNTSAFAIPRKNSRSFSPLWWCVLATLLLLIGFHCRWFSGERSMGLEGRLFQSMERLIQFG